MRLAIRLFGLLIARGSTLLAQDSRRSRFEGVWRITEIVVTGGGASTVSDPQPSVFIVTKTHYSLMWCQAIRH